MTERDIVQRLRASLSYDTPARYPDLVTEAADKIERLQAAIRWALGETPDSDGQWFGENRPEEIKCHPRPFWWRKNLRRISGIDAEIVGK